MREISAYRKILSLRSAFSAKLRKMGKIARFVAYWRTIQRTLCAST
ncbi:MAG: hypothetical protein VB035_13915 [Candidatus Fimivivens sp.]|nr:hypothetical protein [Candidatus Fimivivens sp.]